MPAVHQCCTAWRHGYPTFAANIQVFLFIYGEGQIRRGCTDADPVDAGGGRPALLDAGHHGGSRSGRLLVFPQRCSDTIRWLIVYVMLSRPRSLATLKSVNLTRQIRDIIEQGAPEDLVANFDRLFREKVDATRELAGEAARAYSLLPEFF